MQENIEEHTISTVICAYALERWEDLVQAVASVQQQSRKADEIIVVIDHNEELWKRAKEKLMGTIVIKNTGQSGLSGARNSGVKRAYGDLIAFLDDDARADKDWLKQLERECIQPGILGAGGAVLPDWSAPGAPAWFPEEFHWVVGCSYRGMPTKSAPVRNPIGASMCIRRQVFEEIGYFRSEIGRVGTRPVGCEETELCIRARQHWPQQAFMYQPQAKVYHRVPEQRASWRYYRSRCYAEGISKAFVARYVGAKDTLSAESSYTLHTLPQGVYRDIRAVIGQGDKAGLARAGAIVAGLLITTTGYIIGKCFAKKNKPETPTEPEGISGDKSAVSIGR